MYQTAEINAHNHTDPLWLSQISICAVPVWSLVISIEPRIINIMFYTCPNPVIYTTEPCRCIYIEVKLKSFDVFESFRWGKLYHCVKQHYCWDPPTRHVIIHVTTLLEQVTLSGFLTNMPQSSL